MACTKMHVRWEMADLLIEIRALMYLLGSNRRNDRPKTNYIV